MVTKNGLYPAEKYVDEYEKAESEECRKCKGGCGYIPMSGEYACIGFRPMTNAEWIRSMTDEELVDNVACPGRRHGVECKIETDCNECILNWLKQEAKE